MTQDVQKNAEQLMANLVNRFVESLQAGDADRICSLYAEDGVYLPDGNPPVKGKIALEKHYRKSIAGRSQQLHFDISPKQTLLADDLILQWGTSTVSQGPPDNTQIIAAGKQVFIARRKPNGNLELLWDIDNLNG